jgi:hypothetical protein
MWNANRTYLPIARQLREAVDRTGTSTIVDLCSGGGGPWTGLYEDVAAERPLRICLTDLYPSARVTPRTAKAHERFTMRAEPVDARCVPQDLRGFRTIFSSFHHFDPESARAMLADAFARREGIGVFEAAQRRAGTMLAVCAVPFLALRIAARERPIRRSRLFWTYILPVIPAVLWMDGLLSCLRCYSLADFRELTEGLSAPDYEWKMGEERGGPVPVTYLIGMPCRRAHS